METVDGIIKYVSEWRQHNPYTLAPDGSLSEESLWKLMSDVSGKIEKLAFDVPEGKTRLILYSGGIIGEYGGVHYAEGLMGFDKSTFTIYQMKEAKLFGDEMARALETSIGNKLVMSRAMQGAVKYDTQTGQFVQDSPYSVELKDGRKALSITDTISKLFVQRAIVGEVIIIMPKAGLKSVLFRSELLDALNNPKTTSINGEPIANLRARYTSEGLTGVFNYLKSENAKLMSNLVRVNEKGAVEANFDPFIKKPSESWLNNIEKQLKDNLPTFEKWVKSLDKAPVKATAIESYIGKLNLGLSDTSQLTRSVKAMETILGGDKATPVAKAFQQIGTKNMAMYMAARPGAMKAFGAVGVVFIAADAAITIKNANDAFSKGDNYTGAKILHDWGWRTSFGLGAASAAMKLGLPLALLTVAGASMFASAPVAILAGMAAELLIGAAGWHIGSSVGGGISDLIWSLMSQAGLLPARIDPIVLDISGLGITTKSVTDGVYYDLDNNGFSEKTGWIDSKSGILVLDKSGNGKIETGNELFGDRTILENGKTASSGFAALAALDSNRDGVIDAKDNKFSELRIWIDSDGDGFSAPDELMTLEEAGVKSLNLGHSSANQIDENGNTIARVGSFTRTDGTTAEMKEFFLQRDTKDVQMTHSVEIPEDIMDMPELHPMGNTYSLRQAMSRDESGKLKQLIQDFVNDTNIESRQAKLHDILFAWVGVTDVNPKSRGSNFDARKLAVLEIVTGTSYRNSPTSTPTAAEAPILERSYTTLAESIYTMLSLQTNLAEVFKKFNYSFDLESEKPIKLDVTSVQAYLDEQLQADAVNGEKLLAEVTRVLRNRGLVSEVEFAGLREHFAKQSIKYQKIIDTAPLTTMIGTSNRDDIHGIADRDNVITGDNGNDILDGNSGSDILYGDDGDDYLNSADGNDTLIGGAGDDCILGGNGNDVVIGDIGDDHIEDHQGNDTYIFNRGDGVDNIKDLEGVDTIQFGKGISPEDIVAEVVSKNEGIDLELSIKNTDDKITVTQHFGYNNRGYHKETPEHQVENIIFADGTVWDLEKINAKAHEVYGTEKADYLYTLDQSAAIFHGLGGNDEIRGGAANDTLYGGEGSDQLHGKNGDDVLVGGMDDDMLCGGEGNDVLIGSTGNDHLYGIDGDDVYFFNRGDGVDYIEEEGGIDTIQFGESISPDDVIVGIVSEYDKFNLEFSIKGTDDKITVSYHFGYSDHKHEDSPERQIERVAFANGAVWDLEEIHAKAHNLYGTEEVDYFHGYDKYKHPITLHSLGANDDIVGGIADDRLHGGEGDDAIYGNAGDDLLYGDEGADHLYGNEGNDILYGGAGDDGLDGSGGDDILVGHQGNDSLSGGEGSDTYIFSRGDGMDSIVEQQGSNIVKLGYRHTEVILKVDEYDLTLDMYNSNDSIRVYSYYSYDDCIIKAIQSEDGYVIHSEQMQQLIQAMASFSSSHGISWQQALEAYPTEAQSVISQYWTAPTA